MREVFECALLQVPGQAFAGSIDGGDRLRVHVHDLGAGAQVDGASAGGSATDSAIAPAADTTGLIASAALALQRYDVCLLHVEPAALPWVRTALARARPLLRTPVVALVGDVKAAALVDLLELGLADFVRLPVCAEELRARLMRLPGRMALREPLPVYGAAPSMPLARTAAVPRAGRSRARVPRPVGINLALYEPDEPFRQAKARVVAGFERAYLCQALAQHAGNVAQAARASRKHRRAFWALMHKHAIDARTYRAMAADGAAGPAGALACRGGRSRQGRAPDKTPDKPPEKT